MRNTRGRESFSPLIILLFFVITLAVMVLCVALGSVNVPFFTAADEIRRAIAGLEPVSTKTSSIVVSVRLPRVITAGLMGAALSLCGCCMQGLLKNPLADGSTLGVSSGASLGAVAAIAFGLSIPNLPFAGTTVFASGFAFVSLLLILTLSYRLDRSLESNTIILIGVIFSMFASSITSLLVTFSGEKARNIIFWTMGSLSNSSYQNVILIGLCLLIFGGVLFLQRRELNAFAIGEDNARHIGVNVKRVKLLVLICVSILIGVCVSVGGSIAFVGLVTPHMARFIVGPNHYKLVPASLFSGAIFLMLSDLAARTVFSPRELPIGVVTSFVGALLFVHIFYTSRRAK